MSFRDHHNVKQCTLHARVHAAAHCYGSTPEVEQNDACAGWQQTTGGTARNKLAFAHSFVHFRHENGKIAKLYSGFAMSF